MKRETLASEAALFTAEGRSSTATECLLLQHMLELREIVQSQIADVIADVTRAAEGALGVHARITLAAGVGLAERSETLLA